MTAVPPIQFTDTGPVAPTSAEVLSGVQSDMNTAFGGNLNPNLETPQGQLATSEAAIIAQANSDFISLVNNTDPAYASGRFQDAIGRIYYITRNPAQSTTIQVQCIGAVGVPIPVGASVQDPATQDIYYCTQAGTIPSGGSITLAFANATTGPIAVPLSVTIYGTIPGWDTATIISGVIGNLVESRADFEFRREQSVALNAQGSLPSVLGAVFAVSGVIDAYATENVTNTTSGAVINGTIVGTTLTVNSLTSGTVAVGQMVVGTSVEQGTIITGGSGTSWTVNISQSVGPESMTCAIGGVQLAPNSLYVAVSGGAAASIAQAIWNKKSPGCNYNGNTTVAVADSTPPYTEPYPTYNVSFETPTAVPILFSVSMQNNPQVPANATVLIQNAIIATFTGSNGSQRARIGSTIFHSQFYQAIFALGAWVQIIDIQIGVGAANKSSIAMQINQVPTISSGNISVSFS